MTPVGLEPVAPRSRIKHSSTDPPYIGFQDQLSLNTASTFIKLPFVIKIIVLSIFEWPFKTGFYCTCI